MVTSAKADVSVADLDSLASALETLVLPVDHAPDAPEAAAARVVRTIRSYLIPRLVDPARPLTVVFSGPTGAGKSTLLNSVSGSRLTLTGPLRPTTKAPVVFAKAANAASYESIGGIHCEVVKGTAPILSELTIIDTPDIDSTALDHRAQAEALIDVADVVVFVSSALRYADSVPWEVLRRAQSRGAPVIPVLNRIKPDSGGALLDYRRLLDSEGIEGDVLAIGEHHLEAGAFAVPSGSIRDLRARLVGEIEAHRSSSQATWERVLDWVCAEALELISSSESHADLISRDRAAIAGSFQLDEGPLLAGFSPRALPPARPAPRAGASRLRIRLWAWRALPRAPALAQEEGRLVEALVTQLEGSLRERAGATDRSRILVPGVYESLRSLVDRWMTHPSEALELVRDGDRRLLELILRIGAVTGLDWHAETASLLAPEVDGPSAQARLADWLRSEFGDILETTHAGFAAELPAAISPEDLERARSALSTVMGNTSFANA